MDILSTRPALAAEIAQVAEVARYLWEKGWAERNGGNIVVNITQLVDDELRALPPILPARKIGTTLPYLKGTYFYCKGTGKRMRDLARCPMDNGAIVRITDTCDAYEIIADKPVIPTSECASHFTMHNYLIQSGSTYRASVHTHPIELVAMSHNPAFLKKDVMGHKLWGMIPETLAFAPLGLGIVPYAMPGSVELANATLEQIKDYDVVMWEKHGVCAVGKDVMDAFDQIDVLNKAALIYTRAKSMGFEPEGMTDEAMQAVQDTFCLPKTRPC